MSSRKPAGHSSRGAPKGVTHSKLPDGSKNPKYVDLLQEDRPIAGQKFCCISFVSPEKVLKDRDHFLFSKFVQQWGFTKPVEVYSQFLAFISYKYNLNMETLTADLKEFIGDKKKELEATNISDDFKTFLDNREEQLGAEFDAANEFQTCTRGLKIRGSFPTQEEAEMRSKLLRETDPDHDIFVGPVGTWMPWDPEAYKTGRVEYMESELNQLMTEKKQNEMKAKDDFDGRIREAREKAIRDNIQKAQESGNKLTQTIDDKGNLVGVTGASTVEDVLGKNSGEVSTADIRKELFEGENIVMEKDGDHGMSELSINKKIDK